MYNYKVTLIPVDADDYKKQKNVIVQATDSIHASVKAEEMFPGWEFIKSARRSQVVPAPSRIVTMLGN